ncbi:uncharacterized protein LOC143934014 [Lithobates pipiens]
MEFLSGGTLWELIGASAPLDDNIIRDLKPVNILLDSGSGLVILVSLCRESLRALGSEDMWVHAVTWSQSSYRKTMMNGHAWYMTSDGTHFSRRLTGPRWRKESHPQHLNHS